MPNSKRLSTAATPRLSANPTTRPISVSLKLSFRTDPIRRVANDADHLDVDGAIGRSRHHRLANRRYAWPQRIGERLCDDDRLRGGARGIRKVAAGDERHAERVEERRGHTMVVRQNDAGRTVTSYREIEPRGEQVPARHVRSLLDIWQSIDLAGQRLQEKPVLIGAACSAAGVHRGQQDVAGLEPEIQGVGQ